MKIELTFLNQTKMCFFKFSFHSPNKGVRRGSVFSTAVTVDADWNPPVFDKTEEERSTIRRVIDRNILFMNLDEKTKDIIVNAMAKRRFNKGSTIIKEKDIGY